MGKTCAHCGAPLPEENCLCPKCGTENDCRNTEHTADVSISPGDTGANPERPRADEIVCPYCKSTDVTKFVRTDNLSLLVIIVSLAIIGLIVNGGGMIALIASLFTFFLAPLITKIDKKRKNKVRKVQCNVCKNFFEIPESDNHTSSLF